MSKTENIEYESGYEYAKRRLIKSFETMKIIDLFKLLREFRSNGFRTRDYYAIGQSQVILEVIQERLEAGAI